MTWIDSVEKFLALNGKAKQSQKLKHKVDNSVIVEALIGWLNTEITEYTEGSYEAVARRAVWVFPNGYMLTVGTSINPTIAKIETPVSADDAVPFECMDESKWYYEKSVNGWTRIEGLEPKDLSEFISLLTEEVGKPYLGLPWRNTVDNIADGNYELEWFAEPEDEKYELYKSQIELLNIFTVEDSSILKNIPWEVKLGYEDDFMSEYCDYYRFGRLASFLEETGEWIVILDEHCGACSSGTRKSIVESNPKLEGKPEFLTWGQNSQYMYLPNGQISVVVSLYEDSEEKYIKQKAHDFGLDVGAWEEPDFEASGDVVFGDA